MDTITDSHGYRTKRDNGFDVTTYRLSGKLTDQLVVRSYVTAWWASDVMVLVSTVMTFLSKWSNLAVLWMRPDEGRNHDWASDWVCISLTTTSSAFGRSTSEYQVGTITDGETHQDAVGVATDAASYDASVKVGDTIYVVLYSPPLVEETVKYAAGYELLVGTAQSASTIYWVNRLRRSSKAKNLPRSLDSQSQSPR